MARITDRAKSLRGNPTEAEKKLWRKLQHEQMGTKFRRQHPVPPYIVDFCSPEYWLVIEADGGQHNDNPADDRRTVFLEAQGYTVLRFWNNDILSNIEGVAETIMAKIASMPKQALPPVFGREGQGGRGCFASLRYDFPVLQKQMNGQKLAYLDSAASAQKPQVVIDAVTEAMSDHYANIHRGLYSFSQQTTQDFEKAREKVSKFIDAYSAKEIVFTRNATEAVNLVVQSWGRQNLNEGDEVILSMMEHHANLVPWQILKEQKGLQLKFIPVLEDGTLDYDGFMALLSPGTRMISVVHISNALGTINDVKKISSIARQFNPAIKVLVDGSQSVVHSPVNIRDLDCDFFAFTGHKLYGPTGIGVLWGRYELLESMPPYQGGGDMIEKVTLEHTTFKEPPGRFEAGTPAIAEAIGLGAAIDYVSAIGMEAIQKREQGLFAYAMERLKEVPGLCYFGTGPDKAGIISFTADWAHPSDIAMILDQCGVAVRSGHHCCQPLMQRFGIEATVRASLGLYSDEMDIDQLVEGLLKAKSMLS